MIGFFSHGESNGPYRIPSKAAGRKGTRKGWKRRNRYQRKGWYRLALLKMAREWKA